MFLPSYLARGGYISALVLLTAAPAFAGNHDRAAEAISAADAKIDAANKIGASGEVPGMIARASAELAQAREDLKRGHERMSFDEATHAAQLADTALGAAQQSKLQAERDQRSSAEVAASAAQADAADANARAANAEQAASMAAADAARARATPPAATTVVVEKVSRAPVKKKTSTTTTVSRSTPAAVSTEESTTVTTNASGQ